MVGQWVYTPRTLPPRVLFPDASAPAPKDDADEFSSSDDDLEGFTTDIAATAAPAAAEVTPIRERFCLQKRALNEEYNASEAVHKCEACNTEIGTGICKGCNEFLCYNCVVKPNKHGCKGLLCCECGFMACGSCSHTLLAEFVSRNQMPSASEECSTCPSAWSDWARRCTTLPPPTASTSRKRKTYDRFFCSFSPIPTEGRPSASKRSHYAGPEASDHIFGASEDYGPLAVNCVKNLLSMVDSPRTRIPHIPTCKEPASEQASPGSRQLPPAQPAEWPGASPGAWMLQDSYGESPVFDTSPADDPSTTGRDSDTRSPSSLSGFEPTEHAGCLTPLLGVSADKSDPSAIAGLTPVKRSGGEDALRELDTNCVAGHPEATKLWEGVVGNAISNPRRSKRVSCIVRQPSGNLP